MNELTDKKLLALAAKAAGYAVRWHESWQCFVHEGPYNITSPPTMAGQRMVWIPLDDDGDVLRLAVKLRLDLCVSVCRIGGEDGWYNDLVEKIGIEAATRRAIVCAAAAKEAAPQPASQLPEIPVIEELQQALGLFVKAAYPVSTEINPRGHNWSEAYLDAALENSRAAMCPVNV